MTASPISKRQRDLFDSIWRASGSAVASLVLIALLIITLVSMAQIPGVADGLRSAQLSVTQRTDLGATQANGQAGYLVLSIWLRVLLAAMAFNLLLRLANAINGALRMWRRDSSVPYPAHLSPERLVLSEELGSVSERVGHALAQSYPQVLTQSQPTQVRRYATRQSWAAVDGILVALGPLLVLFGLALNSTVGWQNSGISLPPGEAVPLEGATSSSLSLGSAADDGNDIAAVFLVVADGVVSPEQRITDHRPGHWGDQWVALQSTGPALIVTAKDDSNRALLLQSLDESREIGETLKVLFRSTQTEQAFAVPTRDLAFRVVSYPELPERDIATPVFLVEAYRSDAVAPVLSELVTDQAVFNIDDTQISLRRDRFAIVDTAYLPGVPTILIGALLTLAGIIIGLFWPQRSAWVDLMGRGQMTVAFLRVHCPGNMDGEREALKRSFARPVELNEASGANDS